MSHHDTPQVNSPRPIAGRTGDQTPWDKLTKAEQRQQFLQCAMREEGQALVLREELARCTVAGQRNNLQGALRRALDKAKAYRRHAADLAPALPPDAAEPIPLVQGGQGRSGEEIAEGAGPWAWIVVGCAIMPLGAYATAAPYHAAGILLAGLLIWGGIWLAVLLFGRSGEPGGEQ
jgi:hypothetical protein